MIVKRAHPSERRAESIRTEIRRPDDHVHYGVELEPHMLMQWTDLPFRTDVGVGLGFRASIPILDQGPLPRINNNLAISFGMDWAHFGACRSDEPGCGGDDFWFPIVMQWNFFLTRYWSVFPEIGLAIHHAAWGWNAIDGGPGRPCGPGPRVCDFSDNLTEVAFASWLGTRFSLSDLFSFTLRLGYPSLVAGVSFRL